MLSLAFVARLFCGEPAPDFTLYTTDGQKIELSDLRGRIIVIVFLDHRSSQSILTARAMETRLWRANFQNRMIYLFGILVVASQADAAGFKDAIGLTYPILFDTNGDVWNRYKISDRTPLSVIIGRNGTLEYIKDGFNANEIIQKVNELQSSNIYFTTWWKIKELFRKNN
ncbi:MAG: peroxiredoxin family protein [bacterium]